MAFLNLNGWAIPIASAREKPIEIGSRAFAFDGSPLIDRRGIKRAWDFETAPLDEMTAEAVRGVVQGRGDLWRFNGNLYSDKGQGTSTGSTPTQKGSGATSGDWIFDSDGKIGVGERLQMPWASLQGAITNLMAADVRKGESVTGTTAKGAATRSVATDEGVTGDAIKVVCSAAANDGIDFPTVAVTPGTSYTASFWMRSDANENFSAYLEGDDGPTVRAIKTLSVGAGDRLNAWHYFTFTGAAAGSDTTFTLRILKTTTGAANFYVDQIQIETGTLDHGWVDGSGSATDLEYAAPSWLTNAPEFTASFWLYMPATPGSDKSILWIPGVSNPPAEQADLDVFVNSSGQLRFVWGDGTADVSLTSGVLSAATWYHIALVFRHGPEGSEVYGEIHVDGSSVATDGTIDDASHLTPRDFGPIHVGHKDGTQIPDGFRISDLMIVPYAMPVAQVLARYTTAHTDKRIAATLPKAYVDGDIIPDNPYDVQAIGQVDSAKYQGQARSGTWRNNNRQIKFALREV